MAVCDVILDRLAKEEPCTLVSLMDAVFEGCGICNEDLMPQTIIAIVALMDSNEICRYVDEKPLDGALDYSWMLSKELPCAIHDGEWSEF